jgi:flagellar biosynthesis GTPase FlhF
VGRQAQAEQPQANPFALSPREDFDKEIQQMRDEGVHETLINDRIQSRAIQEYQAQQANQQHEYNQQLASYIQQQQQAQHRQAVANEARSNLNWFEQQIASVPPEYKDVLGEGNSMQMDQMKPEFNHRNQLMLRIQHDQKNWQQLGFQGPQDPSIFQKALFAEFGSRAKTQAVKEVKQALRTNENAVTARPTHSESKKLSRRDQAIENAENSPFWKTLDGDVDEDPDF